MNILNIFIFFCISSFKLNHIESKNQYLDLKNGKVCSSIAIRKKSHLRQLENCTVIEGHLYIFLVNLSQTPKKNFPLLKEITESLLLYHVKGIKSLEEYFPNLSLIRGQSLTYNYALVIKDTSLMNVGLRNLKVILTGGIRIDTNPLLCYISSINWTDIVKQTGAPINIINTRKICPDFCPMYCLETKVRINKKSLCWSRKYCQKICAKECNDVGLSCVIDDINKCCHRECLAGCHGLRNDQCISCKNVIFEGKCLQRCPKDYYKFNGRRCISEKKCLQKVYHSNDNVKVHFALEADDCVKRCSQGKERDKDTGKCKECGKDCLPKNCDDILIHSISDLKQVDGCYSVKELHINIKEGEGILSKSLEKYFSKLTVIEGSIKIIQSSSITSLDFLKSLRVIKGQSLTNGTEADGNKPIVFEVYGNDNLVHIWKNKAYEEESFINISSGLISFKLNSKLCPEKIIRFLQKNIKSQYELLPIDLRIINASNGGMAYCNDQRLIIEKVAITDKSVTILCNSKSHQVNDQDGSRSALFMIKQTNRDLSPYELYNNCHDQGWRIIEGQLGVEEKIGQLNPATRYAVYAEAIRSRIENWLEISDFLYFTTNTTYPSSPVKFRAESISDSEIKITWSPPLFPNGVINHYFIWYQKIDISYNDFIQNEQCSDKSYLNVAEVTSSVMKSKNERLKTSLNETCNCNNCLTFCAENQERIDRITNDFGFHLSVYHTMASLHSQFSDHVYHLPFIYINDNDTQNESTNVINQLFHSHNTRNLSLMYSKNEKIHFQEVSVEVNSYVFKNLHHFSEYLFEIQACQESVKSSVSIHNNVNGIADRNGNALCSERSSISGYTLPKKDADNINISTVEVLYNHNNVIIKWFEPRTPNGLILYFIIRYKIISSERRWIEKCVSRLEWLKKSNFENNNTKNYMNSTTFTATYYNPPTYESYSQSGSIQLNNLRLAKYEFQIKTVSTAGQSSWSTLLLFEVVFHSLTASYKEAFIIGFIFAPIFIGLAVWFIYHYYRKKFLARKKWVSSNPDYWLIYEIDEWEIKRDDVDMIGWNYALGRGSFGLVYKGVLKNLTTPAKHRFENESSLRNIVVAVKTLNTSSTVCERREFINEACYMKQFQSYHLVLLYGIVSKIDYFRIKKNSKKGNFISKIPIVEKVKLRAAQAYSNVRTKLSKWKSQEKHNVVCNELELLKNTIQQHFQKMPLVVMELMENGDLAGYLRKQGEEGEGLISETQALLWALQIADGMLFLSDKKFVHRDLAARNCMVNADIIVKIGDFGMARDVYYDCYYRKKGPGRLPVRWMAPEGLRSAYFTIASDIWSYGVIIWEIVTLASMPFRGMSHHDVIQFVTSGGNLLTNSAPISCSKLLLTLMQNCWQPEAQERPSFQDIITLLKEFADTNFRSNSYYFKKEAQSTISSDDASTDVISNYSRGNTIEQCEDIV